MSNELRDEFDRWLRTECFQAPPKHCESLAWSAWKEARRRFGPLPRALTAENGAKTALSGEFFEHMEIECHECFERDAPDPEHCPDSLRVKRPPPDPDDEGPSAGLDLAKAGKWRG